MGRAATIIDIDAIGLIADDGNISTQFPQQSRRNIAGSAVGAVRQDFQPRQIGLDGGGHEVDIVPLQLAHTVVAAADLPRVRSFMGSWERIFSSIRASTLSESL